MRELDGEDELIAPVIGADGIAALDVIAQEGVKTEEEYAAKYLICWRFNNFRPPHNSFWSSTHGMLHEASSPIAGSVTMESPHVPCASVSGQGPAVRIFSHLHSSPPSSWKYVEPRHSDPH